MTVKIASKLPQSDDHNGLTSITDQLTEDPTGMHVAVVILDCSRITTDVDTGEAHPTVRILRVEPISDPEAKSRLGQFVRRAQDKRLGKTVLDLSLEDQINAAFGVNPDTGEITD